MVYRMGRDAYAQEPRGSLVSPLLLAQGHVVMLKPRQIAEALPDVTARKAGDWLRGDRSPSVVDLARILEAFPDIDARAFVVELAIRRTVKG